MSKFNNPIRTLNPPRTSLVMTPPVLRPAMAPATPVASVPIVSLQPGSEPAFVGVGFAVLCVLVLSQYVNEWALRLVGSSTYISIVAIVACPVLFFLSGNAFRGFRDRVGVWWLAFVVLILLGVPFSIWRTGSIMLLKDYLGRSWVLFFYVVAFTTTIKRCRTLMMMNVICAAMLVVTCGIFGVADEAGRFHLPGSPFFNNANDLGLQLTLSICLFLFLIIVGGKLRILAGVAGILLSLMFMLKTGSRGCALSVVCLFGIVFWATRRKVQLLLLVVPMLFISVLIAPSVSLDRISLLINPNKVTRWEDVSAIQSRMEREELFKTSLYYTITHPVFGVGAGQFAVAIAGEAEKVGEHASWLGTHNSYTQVSAECGIPAFCFYVAIIVLTVKRTYAVYKFAAGRKEYREIEGLGFCMFAMIIVYAVATFFYHMAFTSTLPLITGQAVALYAAVEPLTMAPPAQAPAA